MKKYITFFILLILLAPCVGAQTFRRSARTPGFFVPKGALQNSRQEKLVPVEAMRYQGKQAPVIAEIKRKQAQEKAKQEALAKLKKEQEAQQAQNNNAAAKAEEENSQTTAGTETAVFAENANSQQSAENIIEKETAQDIAEHKADDKKFAQIIEEYQRDVVAISKGNPIRNQRLIDMIADYKDFEHSI